MRRRVDLVRQKMQLDWRAGETFSLRRIIGTGHEMMRLVVLDLRRRFRHEPAKDVVEHIEQRPAAAKVLLKIDDHAALAVRFKLLVPRQKPRRLGETET